MILLCLLALAPAAGATPGQPWSIEKVCAAADYCDLQNASPDAVFGVLNGGQIRYLGPIILDVDPKIFVSSEIEFWSAGGELLAEGHVAFIGGGGDKDRGYFTITQGYGPLVGLHASGNVRVVDWATGFFRLEGTYHFAS